MEKIQTTISVITSIITFVTLVYKLGIKNGRKKEITYYNMLLQPYVSKIKSDEEIDTIKFVKETIGECDDFIPRYVYCLLEKKEADQLKKILLCDYISLYPNDENSLDRIMDYISKSGYYILFILAFLCMIMGTCSMSMCIPSLLLCMFQKNYAMMKLGNYLVKDWQWYLYSIIISLFIVGIGILLLRITLAFETDRYSIKRKIINKAINKKIDRYEKNKDKYVI